MLHTLVVTRNDAGDMVERSYTYEVEMPDKTPAEQVEAHLKAMLKILEDQANAASPDDDDDGDDWKSGA